MNLTSKHERNYLRSGQLSTYYGYTHRGKTGQTRTLNNSRVRTQLIKHFFAPIERLSSQPVYTVTRRGVLVNMYYYRPEGALNRNSINNLGEALTKVFDRPVKLELIKLHYPHLNRDILARYLSMNRDRYTFSRLKTELFKRVKIVSNAKSGKSEEAKLPSHIVGMKVEVSGRLVTERSRPRQTVSSAQIGRISGDRGKLVVDYGSHTNKNAKGSYTVKVWIRQQVSPNIT